MTESWMEEFERRLQKLEREVDTADGSLLVTAQATTYTINALWDTVQTSFWIVDSNDCLRITGDGVVLQPTEITKEICEGSDEATVWGSASQFPLTAGLNRQEAELVLIRRHVLADDIQLIVISTGSTPLCSRTHAEEATAAATALFAIKATRYLLTAARIETNRQTSMLAFTSRLQVCNSSREVHEAVAHENGRYLPNCRISSLEFNGRSHRVIAVTGVAHVNNQASQIKQIESLLNHFLADDSNSPSDLQHGNDWISIDILQTKVHEGNLPSELMELIEDFRTTGVQHILATPINCNDRHVASVLIESYESESSKDIPSQTWQQAIESATARCLSGSKNTSQTYFTRWSVVAAVMIMAATSFFVPMEFELPVAGQLVAQGRRSIFAPESGIVMNVGFTNEQEVKENDILIQLSNPELSLRMSELDGEIATTLAAVAAANARRISRTADSSAAEGQILKQRLKSLQAERVLTQQRIDSLDIKAPFDGIIVRRDAEQTLTNRPLQRGLRIAELIPKKTNWELELHVPQEHFSYITNAQDKTSAPVVIRYIINSEPEMTYSSTVHSIEQFTYMRNNVLVQNAKSMIELPDSSNAKSGTSVSARVNCGKRSVGFVATRKLIELFQHLRFVWWS